TKVGFHAESKHPLLPDMKYEAQGIHINQRHGHKSCNSSQMKGEKSGQVRYHPGSLCSPQLNRGALSPLPPISAQKKTQVKKDDLHAFEMKSEKEPNSYSTTNDQDKMACNKKEEKEPPKDRKILKISLDTRQPRMSPLPETEVQRGPALPCEDHVETAESTTPIFPHLSNQTNTHNSHGRCSWRENGGAEREKSILRSVCVDSSLDYSPLSRVNYYGGHMEGSPQMRAAGAETHVKRANGKTDPSISIFHVPPNNCSQLVKSGSDMTLPVNKPEFKDKGSCENVPRRELQHRHPALKVETRRDGSSERRLRRKVLLLIPAETQHPDDNQPQEELHGIPVPQAHVCDDGLCVREQKPLDTFTDGRCRVIEMELTGVLVMLSESCASVIPSDISPAPGPLPALLGRRGPGRQSSMAVYRQILQEHADTSETQTGNSRGTIPLELR
ncbi:hypothetical protein DNTS_025350, partial [Danionella cerebrum]